MSRKIIFDSTKNNLVQRASAKFNKESHGFLQILV